MCLENGNVAFVIEEDLICVTSFQKLAAKKHLRGLKLLVEKCVFADYDGTKDLIATEIASMEKHLEEVQIKAEATKEKNGRKEIEDAKQTKIFPTL